MFKIRNYHEQISIGPYRFYQEPKQMRMTQQRTELVEWVLWGSNWYGVKPHSEPSLTARLSAIGNEFLRNRG